MGWKREKKMHAEMHAEDLEIYLLINYFYFMWQCKSAEVYILNLTPKFLLECIFGKIRHKSV